MLKRGFVEVQTPILQMNPGGAVAKPFKTKSQTSRNKFYLRISLELYLKKLIILGLNKVFELGKVFRNEGLSTAHNFEFTVLEAYISFTCYKSLLKLTYCLICFLTIKLIGACLVLRYQKYKISVFNV
ncbi:hypothetical protein E5P55_00685 [Candidatus Pinguicoccus supinus]|uniref:Aminoacyl-transfer RNA synthetases class-II family profile domain-containing protein n=1 Tax=Candidatus Pinguicoccus supinus TaxID=2529394 RepID=A0A7T0BRM1_9BACT|nr:hypothetical protein E5P55_00685 [Candidatus Pinguicoccus supinus]